MALFEANFDGLVGMTHNYAGLSVGNVASCRNASLVSNPKAAAKQGLLKAKALADMGLVQGILPPHERPDVSLLKQLGFYGSDAEIINQAAKVAPQLLTACSSASNMWTANAATVSSSAEAQDGKMHFTPANLVNKFHRSIEANTTGNALKAIFNNDNYFVHHSPLPSHALFGDEGAANHTRLSHCDGNKGIEVFAYGTEATNSNALKPKKYPARQTLEASQAIARLHHIDAEHSVFIQQNPDVIDKGVFHNDVIAVGNRNVLFYHQHAFVNTKKKLAEIKQKLDNDMYFIEVSAKDVSLDDAINTYLFNSQLISLPNQQMVLIAPSHCQENAAVFDYLNHLIRSNTPITKVEYFDVKQSMQNGGGPACLRLRVPMTNNELAAINESCLLTDKLFNQLNNWVDKHYRDKLSTQDLTDPQLLIESRTALDELTKIMNLGMLYPFQKE